MRALALIAVVTMFAFTAGAHADPPANSAAPPSVAPPDPDPIRALYPPAALAAGVAGKATLSCGRSEHGGLTNCQLVTEDPAAQGFGAAALALAAKAVEPASVSLPPERRGPQNVTFDFKPSAPWITPDVLKVGWAAITQPRWLRTPLAGDFSDTYPQHALQNHIAGGAVIHCGVTATGWLTDCEVTREAPPGYGFGAAALAISHRFRLAPETRDGVPAVDGTINIPIRWFPPPNS